MVSEHNYETSGINLTVVLNKFNIPQNTHKNSIELPLTGRGSFTLMCQWVSGREKGVGCYPMFAQSRWPRFSDQRLFPFNWETKDQREPKDIRGAREKSAGKRTAAGKQIQSVPGRTDTGSRFHRSGQVRVESTILYNYHRVSDETSMTIFGISI